MKVMDKARDSVGAGRMGLLQQGWFSEDGDPFVLGQFADHEFELRQHGKALEKRTAAGKR